MPHSSSQKRIVQACRGQCKASSDWQKSQEQSQVSQHCSRKAHTGPSLVNLQKEKYVWSINRKNHIAKYTIKTQERVCVRLAKGGPYADLQVNSNKLHQNKLYLEKSVFFLLTSIIDKHRSKCGDRCLCKMHMTRILI